MLIDIFYIILLAFAVFKGYSKGFVIAVFSLLAIFIGLAAALKLSATVAVWLGRSTNIGERLLPVLAFTIVLIGVAFVTRLAAAIIEKTVQIAMLGIVNKFAGVILYIILYTLVFSIVLFYAVKISLLKNETLTGSFFYPYLQPWGPKSVAALGEVIPIFKNMFQQLENFFSNIAAKSKSVT